MEILKNITQLKELMKNNQIDAYIIQDADPHQSEYVAEHFKSRTFLTGFTGSNGTAVITLEHGDCLWTDGRYFLQAEQQLEGTNIQLQRMGEEGVPTLSKWLSNQLPEGSTVGFDGKTYSYSQLERMKAELKKMQYGYRMELDLVDEVWTQRPAMPLKSIFIHELRFSGKQAHDKIALIRESMKDESVEGYVIGSLDDICWLFNIRGKDIDFSPVAYAYAYIGMKETVLYINSEKISSEVKDHLNKAHVMIKEYNDIFSDMEAMDPQTKIALDKKRMNCLLFKTINDQCKVVNVKEFTALPKACKNKIEMDNIKDCNKKDNIAMVKFLCWVKKSAGKENITELDVEEKLIALRGEMEHNIGASFATIAGYKEHGAIIHYKATKETNKKIEADGFLLVDSGGQYLDGTTDITRTIALGNVTDEMKKHYTLVLKGHINLSRLKFKQGTKGCNIDILARMALWNQGLDYRHGTGHGLGFCLNVHEGPQNISQHLIDQELLPGMLVTNEPGYYVSGEYGIRLENDLLVIEDEKTEWGQFYKFEPVTICPFELDAIDNSLLSQEEKEWLNDYHQVVYNQLVDGLEKNEKLLLKEMTAPIQ